MSYPYRFADREDPLRVRFTRFLEVMLKRARLNYLSKKRRYPETVSIDFISETDFAMEIIPEAFNVRSKFSFEEERLAEAFYRLPLMRQKVLTLLFVEELTPEEVAHRLNCSVGHVYNQRSLALKKLRQLLKQGGDFR